MKCWGVYDTVGDCWMGVGDRPLTDGDHAMAKMNAMLVEMAMLWPVGRCVARRLPQVEWRERACLEVPMAARPQNRRSA
jgi:hypothetical protein